MNRNSRTPTEETPYLNRDAQIAALPEEHRQALFDQAKTELLTQYPRMATFFEADPANAINDGSIRVRVRNLMANGWKPLR